MALRLTFACLSFVLFAAPTLAQAPAPAVHLQAPRPFGYFVGDLIHHEAEIIIDQNFRLDPASTPKPGPRAYWLDLRAVDVEEKLDGGVRRYRLKLEYQTFYAPLETRRMEIPAFTVSFADGAARLQAEVPAWPFLASPMREIIPPKGEGWTYLRPDVRPSLMATGNDWRLLIASTVTAMFAFAALAYDRGWPPFHTRRSRPFAQAARRTAKAARVSADEATYIDALLILHRAFDSSAGRRVLADDVGLFLLSKPAFEQLKPGVERFFAASRRAFFSARISEAMELMPLADVARLSVSLRTAERREQ
jgi:mxaA protein